MNNRLIIKLAFRCEINANEESSFAREASRLSFDEFKMKSQAYNTEKKFRTFSEMKKNDGRANSLHYKLNFSIAGLLQTLQNKMPVIRDLGGKEIFFETSAFELIESDLSNAQSHRFTLQFISSPLEVVMQAGDMIVLHDPASAIDTASGFADCFTVRLNDNLSIIAFLPGTQ